MSSSFGVATVLVVRERHSSPSLTRLSLGIFLACLWQHHDHFHFIDKYHMYVETQKLMRLESLSSYVAKMRQEWVRVRCKELGGRTQNVYQCDPARGSP